MRVLALIPARSGSKGLAHKNVRRFAGEPLLCRAARLARASARRGETWSVLVSTDSRRYRRLAQDAGAWVPFLRPAALARDDSRLIDVVLHALAHAEADGTRFDALVLLSATTPLTTSDDVRAAMTLFSRGRGESVVSVTPETVAASWRFALHGDRLRAEAGRQVGRRQLGPLTHRLNGAIYVATPTWLHRHRQFVVPDRTRAYVMPRERSVDIDDALDLAWARWLARRRSV